MKKFLLRLWWCKIWKWHKWTSAVQQGILATPEQLSTIEGFWNYAAMYCDRCGHISELSKKKLAHTHQTYVMVIVNSQPGIKCLLCERISYNPNDIYHKYCGHCHIFHQMYIIKKRLPDEIQRPHD